MKFAYQFSNLVGTVYCKGDLVFSPDGNSLYSPVGNRLSMFDLKNNKASTLPVESSYNYTTIALSPCGNILLGVNEDGDAHLISMVCRRIIHRYHFKGKVTAIRFSADGKFFAACQDFGAIVFRAPSLGEFGAFSVVRSIVAANDTTTCLDFSSDSNVIAFGSNDCTVRLFGLGNFANFGMYILSGHMNAVIAVFFEPGSFDVVIVTSDGKIHLWKCGLTPDQLRPKDPPPAKRARPGQDSDEEDDIRPTTNGPDPSRDQQGSQAEEDEQPPEEKLNYWRTSKVDTWHWVVSKPSGPKQPREAAEAWIEATAAAYHKENRILVVGFQKGTFIVLELPECNLIHSLNFSDKAVSSIALNNTGDWIALASAELGQLLVWEWQSETYVMKQQGHTSNMTCLSYSGDGQFVVTGGEDGKVKLWNTTSGYCFVTFSEHQQAIVSVVFSNNRRFIISASLDGTVRAFDLTRYRNFRTLATPTPVQFSCLALDSSNEFVAAGCQDVFEIYLWSMKLGNLMEIVHGHEGPVSAVAFSPSLTSSALASISWDGTMRLWDAVNVGSHGEPFLLPALGLAAAWSPDGAVIAVATLNAEVTFFDAKTSVQVGCLSGRNDLGAGLLRTDVVSAKKNLEGKAFSTLCYSPDGKSILCAGPAKNICIYSTEEFMLVRKIQVTQNRSLDGVDEMYNRRKMTEWGNAELWDERSAADKMKMPGARSGDIALRSTPPEVRVFTVQFSPTGQAFGAATTEGLLIYSLDPSLWFDPFQLVMAVTPDSIRQALANGENTLALVSAIRLNEANITQQAFETIPITDIELTVSTLPLAYVPRVLRFVASALECTRHVDLYVRWARWLLVQHGTGFSPGGMAGSDVLPVLLTLQKNLAEKHDSLAKVCDYNKYSIQFLLNLGNFKVNRDATEKGKKKKKKGKKAEREEEEDEDTNEMEQEQAEEEDDEETNEMEQEQAEEEDDEEMLMYL